MGLKSSASLDFRFRDRAKFCQFCASNMEPNWKDINTLRAFTDKNAKITPPRRNGNCRAHQKKVARAINNAREMALLPFPDQMGRTKVSR